MEPLSIAMTMLGWLMLFYGIVEAMNSLVFYSNRRRWEKAQEKEVLTDAEEIKDDTVIATNDPEHTTDLATRP
jgi:hypothetical protein